MSTPQRLHLRIYGAVQGVGFRPFVYRLANDFGLTGWVLNDGSGVEIMVDGESTPLKTFLKLIQSDKPAIAVIQHMESRWLDPAGYETFEIRESKSRKPETLIMPDLAVCPDCLREMNDPTDRRHHYPFINCTNCGPRFSIIEKLPYDRPHTSMKVFRMCPDCRSEYENPSDRRFHAQPTACPECGPKIWLTDQKGSVLAEKTAVIPNLVTALKSGKIIAVKGLGGFHLMVHAEDEHAIRMLRQRKHRNGKPLAVMAPDMSWVNIHCHLNEIEKQVLKSTASPIVLLKRKNPRFDVAGSVSLENPYLGVMLPYTPLHHLIMNACGFPVVATSGNLSDEPICIDNKEALERLGQIADLFLLHDRPIVRHVDDSVVRVVAGREQVVRRARGYAPLPVKLPKPIRRTIMGVGPHLKNTVALAKKGNVFISQHIGDLETEASYNAFKQVNADFQTLYATKDIRWAVDLHPDYLSTKYIRDNRLSARGIQHHMAHVIGCAAENEVEPPYIGFAWDGTGYGPDGRIWGGEVFKVTRNRVKRLASLLPFPLAGGDVAVKHPVRSAVGVMKIANPDISNEQLSARLGYAEPDIRLITDMIDKKINTVQTTSMGRLFDGISAMAGFAHRIRHEGEAAMRLEFAIEQHPETDLELSFDLIQNPKKGDYQPTYLIDWRKMVTTVFDLEPDHPGIPVAFHHALVTIIRRITEISNLHKVVISGGCFQNQWLTEQTVDQLEKDGTTVYRHQRVPPNDGGISLGQVVAVAQGFKLGK